MSSYYAIVAAALIGVLWLLVSMPQSWMNRRHAEIVAGLEEGQPVMTSGGFHGAVRSLNYGTVRLEIAREVEIALARDTVAAVLAPSQEPDAGNGTGADEDSKSGSSS